MLCNRSHEVAEFPSPMGNEVGLIKSEVAEKMLKGGFPSPMGIEVGLMEFFHF